jgi:hypothetical protein
MVTTLQTWLHSKKSYMNRRRLGKSYDYFHGLLASFPTLSSKREWARTENEYHSIHVRLLIVTTIEMARKTKLPEGERQSGLEVAGSARTVPSKSEVPTQRY